MQISQKYYERTFKAAKSKDAYMKVCKWLAINIITNKHLYDSTWKITKVKETPNWTKFKLELFCTLDDAEIADRFCNTCKAMHTSFFINEEYNCSRCNMITFRKRLKESLDVKTTYRQQRMQDD